MSTITVQEQIERVGKMLGPGGPRNYEIKVELWDSLDLPNVTLKTKVTEVDELMAEPFMRALPSKVHRAVRKKLDSALQLQRDLHALQEDIHDLIKAESAKISDYESLAHQAVNHLKIEALHHGVTVPADAHWNCKIGIDSIFAWCDLCAGTVLYEPSPQGGRVTGVHKWAPERTRPDFWLSSAGEAARDGATGSRNFKRKSKSTPAAQQT